MDKTQLMKIKKDLVTRIKSSNNIPASPDIGTWPSDELDVANVNLVIETSIGTKLVENKLSAQMQRAIQKIDSGTYGICDSCQEKISPVRLEAIHYAINCIKCQRANEYQ